MLPLPPLTTTTITITVTTVVTLAPVAVSSFVHLPHHSNRLRHQSLLLPFCSAAMSSTQDMTTLSQNSSSNVLMQPHSNDDIMTSNMRQSTTPTSASKLGTSAQVTASSEARTTSSPAACLDPGMTSLVPLSSSSAEVCANPFESSDFNNAAFNQAAAVSLSNSDGFSGKSEHGFRQNKTQNFIMMSDGPEAAGNWCSYTSSQRWLGRSSDPASGHGQFATGFQNNPRHNLNNENEMFGVRNGFDDVGDDDSSDVAQDGARQKLTMGVFDDDQSPWYYEGGQHYQHQHLETPWWAEPSDTHFSPNQNLRYDPNSEFGHNSNIQSTFQNFDHNQNTHFMPISNENFVCESERDKTQRAKNNLNPDFLHNFSNANFVVKNPDQGFMDDTAGMTNNADLCSGKGNNTMDESEGGSLQCHFYKNTNQGMRPYTHSWPHFVQGPKDAGSPQNATEMGLFYSTSNDNMSMNHNQGRVFQNGHGYQFLGVSSSSGDRSSAFSSFERSRYQHSTVATSPYCPADHFQQDDDVLGVCRTPYWLETDIDDVTGTVSLQPSPFEDPRHKPEQSGSSSSGSGGNDVLVNEIGNGTSELSKHGGKKKSGLKNTRFAAPSASTKSLQKTGSAKSVSMKKAVKTELKQSHKKDCRVGHNSSSSFTSASASHTSAHPNWSSSDQNQHRNQETHLGQRNSDCASQLPPERSGLGCFMSTELETALSSTIYDKTSSAYSQTILSPTQPAQMKVAPFVASKQTSACSQLVGEAQPLLSLQCVSPVTALKRQSSDSSHQQQIEQQHQQQSLGTHVKDFCFPNSTLVPTSGIFCLDSASNNSNAPWLFSSVSNPEAVTAHSTLLSPRGSGHSPERLSPDLLSAGTSQAHGDEMDECMSLQMHSDSSSSPGTSLIDVDHLLSTGVTVAGFKPRPIIRKRKKVMIPTTQKDIEYWHKRKKNNDSAKRSREAKKTKEKNFYRRALELEYENFYLKERLGQMEAQLHAMGVEGMVGLGVGGGGYCGSSSMLAMPPVGGGGGGGDDGGCSSTSPMMSTSVSCQPNQPVAAYL